MAGYRVRGCGECILAGAERPGGTAGPAVREEHVEVPGPEPVAGDIGGELHADGVVARGELSAHIGDVGMDPVRSPSGRAAPRGVAGEELKSELNRMGVRRVSCGE